MNTPIDPSDPTTPRFPTDRRERDRPEYYDRAIDRSEGMGAVVAVVALAALIIVGLLYLMHPGSETPGRVTSEGPAATAPSVPAPAKPSEPVK